LNPLTFFHQLQEAYRSAVVQSDLVVRYYQVAGYKVELYFAGSALPPLLTPALAHLAIPKVSQPDLRLYLWDSESTGVQPPPCPWRPEQVDLRGEVPTFSDERFLTAIQIDVNAVSILDRRHNVGIYWIDQLDSLRAYERAAPLKVLLHWWLRDRSLPMIHAGAVGTQDGAVLLVGKTGAGKSTTALACLSAGLRFISDDRCLLRLDPEPQVLCIYNSAKLHLAQMEHFPHLIPSISNLYRTEEEKALVHVYDFAPQQVVHQLPIRAILLANVAGTAATTFSPVSRMAVLRDFTTSTLVYQPGAAQAEVQMMAELVRRVPCYQIDLGSDLAGIPQAIEKLIKDKKFLRKDSLRQREEFGS
jgi:hypothetical protein